MERDEINYAAIAGSEIWNREVAPMIEGEYEDAIARVLVGEESAASIDFWRGAAWMAKRLREMPQREADERARLEQQEVSVGRGVFAGIRGRRRARR